MPAVDVGVWEGVEVHVRVVWVGVGVGEGVVVSGRPGAENGDREGGVLDDLALGLWGCVGEEVTNEDGGEEVLRGDFCPKV